MGDARGQFKVIRSKLHSSSNSRANVRVPISELHSALPEFEPASKNVCTTVVFCKTTFHPPRNEEKAFLFFLN